MNQDQKVYLCIIISFLAGLFMGSRDTSLYWYFMYAFSFIWGMNLGFYFTK